MPQPRESPISIDMRAPSMDTTWCWRLRDPRTGQLIERSPPMTAQQALDMDVMAVAIAGTRVDPDGPEAPPSRPMPRPVIRAS